MFPKTELYALTLQLQRASISICTNIAEGSGRNSDRDFAHFLEQAYGSLMEVASILYLAFDLHYIERPHLDHLLEGFSSCGSDLFDSRFGRVAFVAELFVCLNDWRFTAGRKYAALFLAWIGFAQDCLLKIRVNLFSPPVKLKFLFN